MEVLSSLLMQKKENSKKIKENMQKYQLICANQQRKILTLASGMIKISTGINSLLIVMDILRNGLMIKCAPRKYICFLYIISILYYSSILIPGGSLLPHGWLGFAYLIALGYLFFGVQIISDIFMESIESITA